MYSLPSQATIEMYNFISTRMLPTPTKIHYQFNLKDISKVGKQCRYQSLLRSSHPSFTCRFSKAS